jgi:hypothetical protein
MLNLLSVIMALGLISLLQEALLEALSQEMVIALKVEPLWHLP